MVIYYPAIIDINPAVDGTKGRRSAEIEGAVGIWFPDVPGCYAAGDDVVEASENARKALSLHLEVLRDEGISVPGNSSLEDVIEKYQVERWKVAMILPEVPSRPVRVNVSIDSDLLDKIDAATSNRSAFLSEGARMMLGRKNLGRPFKAVKVRETRDNTAEKEELINLITKK